VCVGFAALARISSQPLPPSLTVTQRKLLGLPPDATSADDLQELTTITATATIATPTRTHASPARGMLLLSGSSGSGSPSYHQVSSPLGFMSSPGGASYTSPKSSSSPRSPSAENSRMRGRLSRAPGSPYEDNEIVDRTQLDHFLQQQEDTEKLQQTRALNLQKGSPEHATTVGLQKYRPSYRPAPRGSPKQFGSVEFAFANTEAVQEVEARLAIGSYIDAWTERMRSWLSLYILAPLVKSMDLLESVGLSMNTPPPALPATSPLWQTTPQVNVFTGATPLSQQALMNEWNKERHRLERYVKVLGSSSREYIVQRIRELAQGSCLAAFRWDGGGTWKEKEWTSEMPTDSQIVVHLFCTFMDDQMLPDPQGSKTFTSKHFVVFPQTADSSKSNVILYQRHRYPPHFELVSAHPTETWAVMQGRNNLFHSLILLAYCVKTKFAGYLGQLWLGGKDVNLLTVIDQ